LKAIVTEADKSKELLIKELSYSKDMHHDKIKDMLKVKDAEIKLLEKEK